jgi:heat shock protein HtpX
MSRMRMAAKGTPTTRDLGLSIRMLVTLLLVSGVYAGSAIVLLRIFVPLFVNSGAPVLLPLIVIAGIAVIMVGTDPLRAVHAESIGPDEHPELHRILDRLCGLADVPKPELALVHTDAANSFATGFTPGTSTIAVTQGLLDQLEPEELEAVLAHELSHVVNRDGAVMTFAAIPATASAAVSHRFKARWFIFWIGVWWLVVLLKLYAAFTSTLMLILSRYREYAADRGAAVLTGAPEQLMSALQKISGPAIPSTDLRALDGVGCFCIVDSSGRPTHPPVDARLAKLADLARGMGHQPPPTFNATAKPVDSGLAALTPYAMLAVLVAAAWIYIRIRMG